MDQLSKQIEILNNKIADCNIMHDLEVIKAEFLGKSSLITQMMQDLRNIPAEERKEFGQKINIIKTEITAIISTHKDKLEAQELLNKLQQESIDISAPHREKADGMVHPISQVMEELINIFGAQGFALADGPEIEDDFHNFTALNIPDHHPARQMHDTFYLPNDADKKIVLRTHTSNIQIRHMENNKPPYKIIAMGKTYRSDSDMTHTPMFHQIEGLYIDRDVNMGHLKSCLKQFLQSFFAIDNVEIRLRPSFFPFTEPSAEVDVRCSRKNGEIKIGEGDDWLEILGCGMVHPSVLRNVGVDPELYQGFAFGMGIERIAMLKYGISDLRTFFEGDMRFMKQYGFMPSAVPSIAGGL
jgi:phenylalanyl-tRNA synthetase alpha chain